MPELPPEAVSRLEALEALLREWNGRLNLVSRKDVDYLGEHHILHCLAPVKLGLLPKSAWIIDVGTGGGLPGLPLAICYPESAFLLCDTVRKKTEAVKAVVKELGLDNVEVRWSRAEKLGVKTDYVTGRAVTALPTFLDWVRPLLKTGKTEASPRGVLYFKGTLYREELAPLGMKSVRAHDLETCFERKYFKDKFLLQMSSTDILHALRRRDRREAKKK